MAMRHSGSRLDLASASSHVPKPNLIDWLRRIFGKHHNKPKHKDVFFGWNVGQPIAKGNNMPLDLTCTNEEKIQVTLAPVTSTGKPAKLDGAPTWTVIDGNSTLDVAADGLSAFLVSADDPGDSNFLVKADADLGSGVTEVSDTIRLSVAGAQAKSLGLTAAAPVPK